MTGSKKWLDRQHKDPYVQKARDEGYPSRAAYKLLEIQEKEQLFKPGMVVVDLGAAPGGWSKVAAKLVGSKGKVIGLDLLPMDPTVGVDFIQGDFRDEAILQQLFDKLDGAPVDVVMSDMAPNLSGQKSVDQPRSMHLVELAADLATRVLRPEGCFMAKIFHGEGVDSFIKQLRHDYKTVKTRKPKASRSESRENYILALGFRRPMV